MRPPLRTRDEAPRYRDDTVVLDVHFVNPTPVLLV